MNFNYKLENDVLIVSLIGRLDTEAAVKFEAELAEESKLVRGRVTLGITNYLACDLLPSMLPAWRRSSPCGRSFLRSWMRSCPHRMRWWRL